jgi:RNA polymerase sigma-70 factor (ECF subfamily)
MPDAGTSFIQQCLDRIQLGDPAARDALLSHSQERLKALTRRMLKHYPGVRRWEDTDDVFQNVLMRLDRALREIPVRNVLDYLRLASTHMRRELIDLARHYFGPQGLGRQYLTPDEGNTGPHPPPPAEPEAGPSDDPVQLAGWADWHEQIAGLPEEEREVVDLLWYHGLAQEEAAGLLGVSLSTLQRRWQRARIRMMQVFAGEPPS